MRRVALLLALVAIVVAAVLAAPAVVGATVGAMAVLVGGWASSRRSAPAVDEAPAQTHPLSVEPTASEWIETVPCGLMLLGADLTVAAANEPALVLCGRPRADVEGGSLIRAIRDHNIAQIARESVGVPQEVDVGDGQMVRVTATRLEAPVAGASRILALEDVTALRHAQRARSDLVANASHELRTPVTAALALAETLERGVDDEARRREFHERLTGEVSRLSGIVEGLLNLSRLESQSDEFAVEALDVAELLTVAARRIEPLVVEQQSIEIVVEGPAFALGDRERVLEVLANLLDNALRVSPPDGVVTLASVVGDGEVRFEVRDEGPGIAPQDRTRVFERFFTGDESRTGSSTSGLGLAIARHIVSRLGGRIWVADRTPGATLCFTLPLGSRDGAPGTAASAKGSE